MESIVDVTQCNYFDGKEGRIIIECPAGAATVTPAGELKRINELSDGYHTFDELYEFRKMYNAVLFNEWASHEGWGGQVVPKHQVHKSWKHYDGEDCFGGGWFIVSAMLPTGLISNHYKAKDWDLFKVPEKDKALFEFDGHTGADVLKRLKDLTR